MSLQPVFINFNFSVPFQFHKISGNKIYRYKVRDMVSFFFLCPTLMTRQRTSFSISSLSSKLTISVNLFTNMILWTLLVLAVCRMCVMSSK